MSNWTAEIEEQFGTELHRFRLGLGQFRDLERKFGRGMMLIIDIFQQNAWTTEQMRDFLIVALIGGGMSASNAQATVDQNMFAWPLARNVNLFWKIVTAAVVDAPMGAALGKDPADEEVEAGSTSAASSGSEEPSATRPTKSGR